MERSEAAMDATTFNKYTDERYTDQLRWYDSAAQKNHRWYWWFQLAVILFSALTPILIGIDWSETLTVKWFKAVPITTSVIATILAASLKTFKLEENWHRYRANCELLKHERYLFDAGRGDYTNKSVEDQRSLFVEKIEAILARENQLWLSTVKTKEDNSLE